MNREDILRQEDPSKDDLSPEELAKLNRGLSLLGLLAPSLSGSAIDDADTESLDTQTPQTRNRGAAESTSVNFNELEVGRFQIEKELGRGGYGVVFLAYDPVLDRKVALKIPKPELLGSEDRRLRFLREARAAAILSHPNIVPVFESGEFGPVTFLAHEYCEGDTLSEWLKARSRSGPVKPEVAAEIVKSLADAIAHAHQRGVVHRDLKPGNILLDQRQTGGPDVAGQVRIADFGLAKIETDDNALTQSDSIIGTPKYMSPEQAAGSIDEIGSQSDIFSLGVILYELLCGRTPFGRNSNVMTLRAIVEDEPASLRKLNGKVPKDLEAICLKCLEKPLEARYRDATELRADLNAFLNHELVSARRITSLEKLKRWRKRNPVLAGTIAVFSTIVLGLLGATSWQWWRAEANATQARKFSAQVTESNDLAHESVKTFFREAVRTELLSNPDNEALVMKLDELAARFYKALQEADPDNEALANEYLTTQLDLNSSRMSMDPSDFDTRVVIEIADKLASASYVNSEPEDVVFAADSLSRAAGMVKGRGELERSLEYEMRAIELKRIAADAEPEKFKKELFSHLAVYARALYSMRVNHPSAHEMELDKKHAAAVDEVYSMFEKEYGLPVDMTLHPRILGVIADVIELKGRCSILDLIVPLRAFKQEDLPLIHSALDQYENAARIRGKLLEQTGDPGMAILLSDNYWLRLKLIQNFARKPEGVRDSTLTGSDRRNLEKALRLADEAKDMLTVQIENRPERLDLYKEFIRIERSRGTLMQKTGQVEKAIATFQGLQDKLTEIADDPDRTDEIFDQKAIELNMEFCMVLMMDRQYERVIENCRFAEAAAQRVIATSPNAIGVYYMRMANLDLMSDACLRSNDLDSGLEVDEVIVEVGVLARRQFPHANPGLLKSMADTTAGAAARLLENSLVNGDLARAGELVEIADGHAHSNKQREMVMHGRVLLAVAEVKPEKFEYALSRLFENDESESWRMIKTVRECNDWYRYYVLLESNSQADFRRKFGPLIATVFGRLDERGRKTMADATIDLACRSLAKALELGMIGRTGKEYRLKTREVQHLIKDQRFKDVFEQASEKAD